MSARPRVPSYRLHRARQLAVVTLGGQDHYLGPYDSPQSWEKYHRLIAEYLANGGKPVLPPPSGEPLTIQRLCLAHTDFADTYYVKEGKPTAEVDCLAYALKRLLKLYATTPAAEFGPKALKLVRDEFIRDGLVRGTINNYVARIKRMFRWAVENELVPPSTHHALAAVAGLRRNRSAAKESIPVKPVDDTRVNAALPFMSPAVQAMVRLQRLTGCRPGEVCKMRPCDIDRTSDVWCFRPHSHKTEHHDQERRIFIGPQAQAILTPWLDRDPEVFCFSAAEMVSQQLKEKHARRRTPLKYGNRPGTNRRKNPKRKAGQCYTRNSYRRAIERACTAAKIDVWSPNQLRHTAGTEIRRLHGLDAAQVVLGHSEAFVTQIYAERDFQKAEEVMRQVG